MRIEISEDVIRDVESEREICSRLMHGGQSLPDMLQHCHPDDFTDVRYRLIVSAAIDLLKEGEDIDFYTVAARLVERKQFAEFRNVHGGDGADFFRELAEETITSVIPQRAAIAVKEAAIRRTLVQQGQELIRMATEKIGPAKEAAASAIEAISKSMAAMATRSYRTIGDVLGDCLAELDEPENTGPAMETGFYELDRIIRLRPSELVILAARPSVGKTALAMNIATAAATDSNPGILFVSLEMRAKELGYRVLSAEAGIDSSAFEHRQLADYQRVACIDVFNSVGATKLWIADEPEQTTLDIMTTARQIHSRHGLGLVVVDYLQLITPDTRQVNRNEQVSAMTRQLKLLARKLEVPVICLSQLNRQSEGREGNRPKLSDLRDSGAIEQDADIVLLMYRPDAEDRRRILCEVAKQRGGDTGLAELVFEPGCVRFERQAHTWTTEPQEGEF